jgi:hypothetical protein
MRASRQPSRQPTGQGLLWDLLTFDRLLTGPVMHLIYWCGLGVVALIGFGIIGAAVGVAIRGGGWEGPILAVPMLVGGLLAIAALGLLWRGACEFFLAVFQIADDLQALRRAAESEGRTPPAPGRRAAPPADAH